MTRCVFFLKKKPLHTHLKNNDYAIAHSYVIFYCQISWLRVLFHDFFCFAVLLNLLFFDFCFILFFISHFFGGAQLRSITDGQIYTNTSARDQERHSTAKKKSKIVFFSIDIFINRERSLFIFLINFFLSLHIEK